MIWKFLMALGLTCSFVRAQTTQPEAIRPATQPTWKIDPNLPTIFLAGDSTAQPGDPLHTGWGKPFGDFVDHTKANWVNAARGGRSSRTFIAQGFWDQIVARLKPGDFVFIQFGHNDASPINDASRARGVIPTLGDETQEIDNQVTHQHEVVHTYGYYMKKMVDDVKAKGATPILLGITVTNRWKDGHVNRTNVWSTMTKQIAMEEHVDYIDLTNLIADKYDAMGPDEVKKFFPADGTHTNPDGAKLNAEMVMAGLKVLPDHPLAQYLSEQPAANP